MWHLKPVSPVNNMQHNLHCAGLAAPCWLAHRADTTWWKHIVLAYRAGISCWYTVQAYRAGIPCRHIVLAYRAGIPCRHNVQAYRAGISYKPTVVFRLELFRFHGSNFSFGINNDIYRLFKTIHTYLTYPASEDSQHTTH